MCSLDFKINSIKIHSIDLTPKLHNPSIKFKSSERIVCQNVFLI